MVCDVVMNLDFAFKYLILWTLMLRFGFKDILVEAEDYCIRDTFNGKCPSGEVIVITDAKYGRMSLGKCISRDLGSLGCYKDVKHLLAPACSGKPECSYPVLSGELFDTQPCDDEVTSYLQVDYKCIKVTSDPGGKCSSMPVQLVQSEGYISSYVARTQGCGNMRHPWSIDVLPGQRVNFTLVNFSTRSSQSTRSCKANGHIQETGHRNNISICTDRLGEVHLYASNGRPTKIFIDTETNEKPIPEFVLHYKVFGCADLRVPAGGWYKREGDTAVVGCEGQDVMWTLRCDGDHWNGVVGNCTENIGASRQDTTSWMRSDFDLKTITIVCIAMGFVILIVIAGTIIVWKWRENSNHKPPSMVMLHEEQRRMTKDPLPPVPQDSSHYRSLIRQPGPQAYPQPHSQTMARHQPQFMQNDHDDYSTDWRFGTAPWQKQNIVQGLS